MTASLDLVQMRNADLSMLETGLNEVYEEENLNQQKNLYFKSPNEFTELSQYNIGT